MYWRKKCCSNNNLGIWFDIGICFVGNVITASWRIKDFYNLCLMMGDTCLLKSHTHTHTSHSQIYWSCHSGWCEHCQRTPTQGWIVAGGSSLSQYPRGGWWCWQCSAWWSLMPLSCLLHSHLHQGGYFVSVWHITIKFHFNYSIALFHTAGKLFLTVMLLIRVHVTN